MKKNVRDLLRSQSLPEDDLSETEQELLRQMLNKQLGEKWAETLQEKGILRTEPPKAWRVRIRPLLATAAVLLFGAFGWWYTWQQSATHKATAYLTAEFPVDNFRRGDSKTQDLRQQMIDFYEKKDYQAVLNALSPILNEGRAEDYFLAALCYQYLKQYREAADFLEKTRNADPTYNRDEVEWLRGLIYIVLDEKEQAKTALINVANSNSSRKKREAEELLEKIK